jgi:hypothetical protein
MKVFFHKILFLFFLFSVFPAVSFAEISQINFVTEPQSIKPNTLSGKIIIQTQNSSSGPFQTPETLSLELISSSPTGEFSSSANSWKSVNSVTMSKNTANRSFYYKDSSEGTFSITVNVAGKNWSANQNITVSNSTEAILLNDNSSDSSEASEEEGESTTNVSTQSHKLEISAGTDRTISPGSPIWFQATIKKNTASSNPELNWSFGDGNVGAGSLVSHTYKYPGNYVVVLSARAGDIFSISRLKVKVAEPNISVKTEEQYLEISNNGDTEINLFNWKLENKGRGFIFQPNTILLPHSSVKLDKNLLNMKGLDNSQGISLKNSLKEKIFTATPVKEINLNEASKNIENIKKELATIQEEAKNLNSVSTANVYSAIFPSEKVEKQADFADPTETTTSTENIIYEAPKEAGLFSRAWQFLTSVLR